LHKDTHTHSLKNVKKNKKNNYHSFAIQEDKLNKFKYKICI
jgi:hypothetical protein